MVRILIVLLFFFLSPNTGWATPDGEVAAPKSLQPWKDWVLHDAKDRDCPFFYQNSQQRTCRWPSYLNIAVAEKGADFVQEWLSHNEQYVPLPGNHKRWPQEVQINDLPAKVLQQDGVPVVKVGVGKHHISGHISWHTMPEWLPIPWETGLVSLSIEGRNIAQPNLDKNGRLWLQTQRKVTATPEDLLDITVHRRVDDSVPLIIETQINLRVSGREREVRLQRPLVNGFTPQSLNSPIPARIDNDGSLRLQVRPGQWRITLFLRHDGGPVTTLTRPKIINGKDTLWPNREIWSITTHNNLRMVAVEGVPTVDPGQNSVPNDWQSLPSYLVEPDSTMELITKQRGNANPAPDKLSLQRQWWLDFDGKGMTVRDTISGILNRSWRLEAGPDLEPGRVTINGKDRLITRLDTHKPAGVEVRQGNIKVIAVSRMQGSPSNSPAVGWNHDMQSLAGDLHLPPGWRLFHATNVDKATHTWLNRWSLLDLFLTLVTSLAIGRLYGRLWGGIALAGITLTFHEAEHLVELMLLLLAGVALLRVVPEGMFRRLATIYRNLFLLGLVVAMLPFLVQQVRTAIYPQLALPNTVYSDYGSSYGQPEEMEQEPEEMLDMAEMGEVADDEAIPRTMLQRKAVKGIRQQQLQRHKNSYSAKQSSIRQRYSPPPPRTDPDARVQTGPGIPQWQWRGIKLSWNGPVTKDQQLELTLIPPTINRIIALLQALVMGLLVARIAGADLSRLQPKTQNGAAIAILLAIFSAPGLSQAADFPSQELLQEYRQRLLTPPTCLPSCADIPRMALNSDGETLQIRLTLHTQEDVVVPLPGHTRHWLPETVLVNEKPAVGLNRNRDGQLQLFLPAGIHHILLSGPLGDRETVQIPLPLLPHVATATAKGWKISGIHADGPPDANLELRRIFHNSNQSIQSNKTFRPYQPPPFVRVERTLRLGLTWQVETRIHRLTPGGTAVVLEVPLLRGESVTTPGIISQAGKAKINLPPNKNSIQWIGVLESASQLTLTAPQNVNWVESWTVDVSPVWHVKATGIPPIHPQKNQSLRTPQWQPWPGETVQLTIQRPKGVPGPTLTIEKSLLAVRPGIRATDVTLQLSMKSSRGDRHTLQLPEGAELQEVRIDDTAQPIRQQGRTVTLPIKPGKSEFHIGWRQEGGMGILYQTPTVDFAMDSVNAELHLHVPNDRWLLQVGGVLAGPAVLFWGGVLVIMVVAVALGRLPLSPLTTRQWLLLGMGLSTVMGEMGMTVLVVMGWFLLLAWRERTPADAGPAWRFSLGQVVLFFWTLAAASALISTISEGLLGYPDMLIDGNGSSSYLLKWYQDRSPPIHETAWIFSLPIIAYRLLMLAWALWLAASVIRWAQWGWNCFSAGGIWRTLKIKTKPKTAQPQPAADSSAGGENNNV